MEACCFEKAEHNVFSGLDSLSSSSSSAAGRAEGISWISRRLCSVDWRVPSWCSCWFTQEEVKPPSSWDRVEGVGDDTAREKRTDVRTRNRTESLSSESDELTFLGLLLRRGPVCGVPVGPVGVSHVDQPHHCSWETMYLLSADAAAAW